jgi:hypothetical protein
VTNEQQRAVDLIAAANAQVEAPPRLHAQVRALRAEAGGRRRRWQLGLAGFAAAATAATAVAAFVLVLDGAEKAPTVGQVVAAVFAGGGAEEPAPPLADEPALLAVSAEGLPFPNWATPKLGWRATGVREDELEGRRLTTVFYEKGGRKVAYTIVGGRPLEQEGRRLVRKGVELRAADGVVTWKRGDQLCVLVGQGVPVETLAKLAVWDGRGAVPF